MAVPNLDERLVIFPTWNYFFPKQAISWTNPATFSFDGAHCFHVMKTVQNDACLGQNKYKYWNYPLAQLSD